MLVFPLFLLALTVSCTKKEAQSPAKTSQPEEIVRRFVFLSSEAKEPKDKMALKEFCTGPMEAAFEQMSDEQFRLFYLSGNIKIEDMKTLSSNVEKDSATVHYQVVVENKQGTDVTKETNEREAILKELPGGWRIEFIRARGADQLKFAKGMIF